MNADELYQHVRKFYKFKFQPFVVVDTGISYRTLKILKDNNLAEIDDNGKLEIDYEALKKATLTGSIWSLKGIGKSSVMELCQYIVNEEKEAGRTLELDE